MNLVLPHERSLVVFADDWGRHPSSCQHLIKRLLPDYKVLWVNSIGTRSPQVNGFTLRRAVEKIKGWSHGCQRLTDSLWVLDAPMLPWIGSRPARWASRSLVTRFVRNALRRVGISRPTLISTLPHVAYILGDIGSARTIYYCTDDYSHWPDAERDALLAAEAQLQAKSDLVLAVSERLVARNRHCRCLLFPHAVDVDHFASTSHVVPVEALTAVPAPRIGFFGLVYEKLDFELLTQLALQLPHASLVMIGPVDYCPESFSSLPNVHLMGRQAYEDLPRWLAACEVLILPYVLDEMILQSSPLKLKECLATGIPTICVKLPEAVKAAPHVTIADSTHAFVQLVRRSLESRESAETRRARQDFVRQETWDARALQLRAILEGTDSERQRQAVDREFLKNVSPPCS